MPERTIQTTLLLGALIIPCLVPAAVGATPDVLEAKKKELARTVERFHRDCKTKIPVTIEWQHASKARSDLPYAGRLCSRLVNELSRICDNGGRAVVARFAALRCTLRGPIALSLAGKTLVAGGEFRSGRLEPYLRALRALRLSPSETFKEALDKELTRVCLDGENVAVLAPSFAKHPGLSTGDSGSLAHIGYYGLRVRPRLTRPKVKSVVFYEPRFAYAVYSRPGQVLRHVNKSQLFVYPQQQRCVLQCGKEKKTLKLADKSTSARILAKATVRARPPLRIPHALARDTRGRYYYVDRNAPTSKQHDFRVYVGRRGKLRRQKMVDIVKDSEGEIFATARGKLRLWVGKKDALWIRRRQRKKLMRVPVDANLRMIYTELGVYWGKRLHTPCDHF